MSDQIPSIGRIVHYQRHGSPNGQHLSEPSPAIITAVREIDDDDGGREGRVGQPARDKRFASRIFKKRLERDLAGTRR